MDRPPVGRVMFRGVRAGIDAVDSPWVGEGVANLSPRDHLYTGVVPVSLFACHLGVLRRSWERSRKSTVLSVGMSVGK